MLITFRKVKSFVVFTFCRATKVNINISLLGGYIIYEGLFIPLFILKPVLFLRGLRLAFLVDGLF